MGQALDMTPVTFVVTSQEAATRIDLFCAENDERFSRSQVKKAIGDGMVTVNGTLVKPNYRVREGDVVVVTRHVPEPSSCPAEDIPLTVLFEDESLIVLDKPAGIVVHPAAGHNRGTLVNALLFHCHDLSSIGGVLRPGIVHRLDKETSGVMVAAKNDMAHRSLARQFADHTVEKHYQALVVGDLFDDDGVVDQVIGRHPRDRKRMSTESTRGKTAETRWRVERRYGVSTLLDVRIMTGRTHQIRVHLDSIGYPIVGDAVYGKATQRIKRMPSGGARQALLSMRRQALHAASLAFRHPEDGEERCFTAPLPADMAAICAALEDMARNE